VADLFYGPANQDDGRRDATDWYMANSDQLLSAYSLYSRADLWSSFVSHPAEVTGKELTDDRILMTDVVFRWWIGNGWSYNHGRGGPSFHSPQFGAPVDKDLPDLTGINRLYGDGHVLWRSAAQMEPARMTSAATTVRNVQGGGTQDRNFF
jgi:hypothetical protein